MYQTNLKLLAICCVVLVGCANEAGTFPRFSLPTPAPKDWDMSPTDAVVVAMRYTADNEIPLREYGVPRVSSDVFEGERFWAVLYSGRFRIPGDHFMLLINDATKAVEYLPGE